jgi:hypothetical protein
MSEKEGPTTTAPCPACGGERVSVNEEPITHCEWCGAEYPVPGQNAVPGKETQTGQDAAGREEA